MSGQQGMEYHPGLTIRIYTVNSRSGQIIDDYGVDAIPPSPTPLMTKYWPPCQCPLCGGRQAPHTP